MAHHGKGELDEEIEGIQELLDDLGPTEVFPNGKLSEQDMGEVRFSVTHVDDVVILDFGTRIQWLGLTPEQARSLGHILIKRGNEADER